MPPPKLDVPPGDPGHYTKSDWTLDPVLIAILNAERQPDIQEDYHDRILPSDVEVDRSRVNQQLHGTALLVCELALPGDNCCEYGPVLRLYYA